MEKYIQERIVGASAQMGPARIDRMVATSATAAAAVCAANSVRRSKREMADRFLASAAQIRKLYQKFQNVNLGSRSKITGTGTRRAARRLSWLTWRC